MDAFNVISSSVFLDFDGRFLDIVRWPYYTDYLTGHFGVPQKNLFGGWLMLTEANSQGFYYKAKSWICDILLRNTHATANPQQISQCVLTVSPVSVLVLSWPSLMFLTNLAIALGQSLVTARVQLLIFRQSVLIVVWSVARSSRAPPPATSPWL